MAKKIFLFSIIIFCCTILVGQTLQEISFQIFPKDAILKIDSQLIMIDEQSTPFYLNLNSGKYPIEIWASKFELFRDTLVIESDTQKYRKVLTKRSASFEVFKKEIKAYNKARIKRTAQTVGLIAANVGALYYCITNSRLKKLEREASSLREIHLNLATPARLQANRVAFEKVNKKYNRNRTITTVKRTVGIPLVCLSSFLSQRYIKKIWSKKLEAPTIKEDKNPFVFNSLEINNFDASYQLTLKFEF